MECLLADVVALEGRDGLDRIPGGVPHRDKEAARDLASTGAEAPEAAAVKQRGGRPRDEAARPFGWPARP